MKRFLLFAGDCYYPGGGWEDFRGDFDSAEAANTAGVTRSTGDTWDWWHVVDATTMKQIEFPAASGDIVRVT